MTLYPASETKLRKLREQGVMPYSRDWQAIGLALSMLATFFVSSYALDKVRNLFETFAKASGLGGAEIEVFEIIAVASGGVLAIYVTILLFFGLMQTRGWFSCALICKWPSGELISGAGTRIAAWFFELFKTLLLLGSMGVVIYYFYKPFFSGESSLEGKLSADLLLSEALDYWRGNLFLFILCIVSIVAIVGILSWRIGIIMFRQRHKMTRTELEAEYRESELSPEVKQTILDRQRRNG